MTFSNFLFSAPCKETGICLTPNCEHAVKQFSGGTDGFEAYDGRWFIMFGHAGFNSPANNAGGYTTKAKALAAVNHYTNR